MSGALFFHGSKTTDPTRRLPSGADKRINSEVLVHALRTLGSHSDVRGVAVTADGKRAVSASYYKTLKVWDLESGLALRTLEGHSDWACDMAVTADGKRAISASWDKTLKVWGVESGVLLATFTCARIHGRKVGWILAMPWSSACPMNRVGSDKATY